MAEAAAPASPPPPLQPTVVVILALDPGASTGYAVILCDRVSRVATVIEYGILQIDTKSSPYLGDWCLDFTRQLDNLQRRVQANELAVEDYFFSSRKQSGANVNPAYRTAAYMYARSNGLHYEVLGITAWKVFAAGRSTPTREQKMLWKSAEKAKKLMIVQALEQRHGIIFPKRIMSTKTRRLIEFKFDISDAVGQAIYAAHLRAQCIFFKSSVMVVVE